MPVRSDEPVTGVGSSTYTPGSTSFPGLQCVAAYDSLVIVGFAFKEPNILSNVIPDAAGYMPHLAIRPKPYLGAADPRSQAAAVVAQRFGVPLSGNIANPPPIRVDFGRVYLPWAADISIEGGDGPGAPYGTLLITYFWDRAPWHREAVPILGPNTVPNQLTVYNQGARARVMRPACAVDVFTPDGVDLRLDNGDGTYGTVAHMGTAAGGRSTKLGPFSQVLCPSSVDSIEFGVRLS